jgi:NDP-sugar pyrophosphorylase family protein
MSVEDYVAVIFAGGKGNRMPFITEHIPKPFLSIANIPLFWFSLNFLETNGFKGFLIYFIFKSFRYMELEVFFQNAFL